MDFKNQGVRELADVVEPGVGAKPVRFGNPSLPRGDDDAGHERHEHERRGGDDGSMTPGELAGNVVPRVFARRHGKADHVPADVFRELRCGRVPLLWFLPQRLQQDEVEIAAQLPLQP